MVKTYFTLMSIILLLFSSFTVPMNIPTSSMVNSPISGYFGDTLSFEANKAPSTIYDINRVLIIAPEEFSVALQPLIQFKNATGRPTKYLTLEYIYNNFNGVDEAEQVKQAIAAYEQEFEIRYVILFGDCDKFPVRYVYERIINSTANIVLGINFIPTDLYYADLYYPSGDFCSWDADNDGLFDEKHYDFAFGAWYEPPSTYNTDKVDIEPDVAVGRIPASTVAEVKNYVDKLIAYELSAPDSGSDNWFNRAIFISGTGVGIWNAPQEFPQLNETAGILDSLGFETIKIYANGYGGDIPNTPANTNDQLNLGAGFVNIHSHGGSTSWTGAYSLADMVGLNNAGRLPILYSMACWTAAFAPIPQTKENYNTSLGGDFTYNYNWPVSLVGFVEPPNPSPIQNSNDRNAFVEEFLVDDLDGAIAFIGSTEVALAELTEILNDGFFKGYKEYVRTDYGYYVDRTIMGLLGDVWNYAINYYMNEVDITLCGSRNKLYRFNLFGDPSLFVGGSPIQQWAVGQKDILHWNGTIWIPNEVMYETLRSISMVSPVDGWAVGSNGAMMRWSGKIWSSEATFTTKNLYSVDMLGPNIGWAVGESGTILHWDGKEWQEVSSPATGILYSVDMISPWDGWAVGSTILRWDGMAWKDWGNPTSNWLHDVDFINENEGWAVGASGTILHWNGTHWSPQTSPTTENINSAKMVKHSSLNFGWAVGDHGTLICFDGGLWFNLTSPTTANLHSIDLILDDNADIKRWAVGEGGIILYGELGPWSTRFSLTNEDLWDVDWSPQNYPPTAKVDNVTFYTGHPTDPIKFNVTESYDPEGEGLDFFWDFGDGTNDTGASTSHKYEMGIYNVTLYVSDGVSYFTITKAVYVTMAIAPGFSGDMLVLALVIILPCVATIRRKKRKKG
ncbi:MAG: C25 family cysteine peptidase [Promethearchaeota archaeon]